MAIKVTLLDKSWHGAHYWIVDCYLESHSITGNISTWEEITQWCIDTLGEQGDVWSRQAERWYLNGGMFWFRNEADRTAFLLRWV